VSARHTEPGTSALASSVARRIFKGYETYRQGFQKVTLEARTRFENAQWLAVQQASADRLASYHHHVDRTVEDILTMLRGPFHPALRPATRAAYTELIAHEYNAELFETFYNSVHRTLTDDADVTDREMFVTSNYPVPPVQPAESLTISYRPDRGILEMMRDIARDLPIERPWQNQDRDIANVLRSLTEERPEIDSTEGIRVEMLRSIFYRNKGAYLVGRLHYGEHTWPLALPLLLDEQRRLYIDTLICDEDELSIMFSFTRAYFMVHTNYPHALVDFLCGLLPNKKRSELYASIGLHKHGKTVFYRDLLDYLERSDDPFIIAPGIRGMVMTVFALESYQTVFKIIKDRFPPQKNITAAEVRAEVLHRQAPRPGGAHGRHPGVPEPDSAAAPVQRPDLIDELRTQAAGAVEITETEVKIRHVYTERMMTPLNMYIERPTSTPCARLSTNTATPSSSWPPPTSSPATCC
jgi:isocitrate dehydrogenase kinase/phosphatase